MGLGRGGLGPGLRWGLGLAGLMAAGLAASLFLPQAQRFLADRRVAGIGPRALAYWTLVRIPLGTVLLEEVAFRGVLLGLAARRRGTPAAVALSSAAFGLWHVGPSMELARVNDISPRAPFVALSVAGTAAGGAAGCWLRLRTGGIVGPAVVHAATNSLATLAAYASRRLAL